MFLGTSNWFRPIGTLMAERLLYFPSLGFTCALTYPLARGLAHKRWREPAAVAALALVLFYGWRTVARNRDWHDHYALFRSAVEAVPASSLAQANLAAVLLEERSDPRGAVEHARKALEIFPEDPAARYTLAQSYRRLGERELAAREFWEVARLAPRTSGAVAALRGAAEACESLGEPARAIAAYEKLLEWRPKDSAAREALARLNRQTAEASRK